MTTQPFVLVPSEPTPEMLRAGGVHVATLSERLLDSASPFGDITVAAYRAMIAARPSPPSPDAGEVEVFLKSIGGTLFEVTCDWDQDAYERMGDACQTQIVASLAAVLAQQMVAARVPNWLTGPHQRDGRLAWTLNVFAANGQVTKRILDERKSKAHRSTTPPSPAVSEETKP